MCKPACWTYVWGTAKPSGSVSSIYTNCSLTVPDSRKALFPWCLGTNGEILLKWLSASRLRFALTFSWLCLIQRVVWMNKEKGSSRRCCEQPGKAKWLMRLKGRVDLPTSTQTSVPRTEYEIRLKLSWLVRKILLPSHGLSFWTSGNKRDWYLGQYGRNRKVGRVLHVIIRTFHNQTLSLLTALPEAFRYYIENSFF